MEGVSGDGAATGPENRVPSWPGSTPTPSAIFAPLAQLAEASRLEREGSRFKSVEGHYYRVRIPIGRGSGLKNREGVGSNPTGPTIKKGTQDLRAPEAFLADPG